MKYLIGLGNPGEKYINTRHNIGFFIASAWQEARGFPSPVDTSKYHGQVSEGVLGGTEVLVGWPDTYMNHSGVMAGKLLREQGEGVVVVVYDDVDLAIGTWKISERGGAGGHNGLASILQKVPKENCVRVRVGVAPIHFWTKQPVRPTGEKLARFVLGAFTSKEQRAIATILSDILSGIDDVITSGAQAAMNKWN